MAFAARPPDLHRLSLGRESFAVACPLALLGNAFYPVRVPRPAASLAASFSPPLAVGALRFAWVATTNSPEDFHLQVTEHAGHTSRGPPPGEGSGPWRRPLTRVQAIQMTSSAPAPANSTINCSAWERVCAALVLAVAFRLSSVIILPPSVESSLLSSSACKRARSVPPGCIMRLGISLIHMHLRRQSEAWFPGRSGRLRMSHPAASECPEGVTSVVRHPRDR